MIQAQQTTYLSLVNYGAEVVGASCRSLSFIQKVEQTVEVIAQETNRIAALLASGSSVLEQLAKTPSDFIVDPAGAIDKDFDEGQDFLLSYHAELKRRHASACADDMLTEEDGVETAYANLMSLTSDLIDKLQEIRDQMAEHDVDAKPISKSSINLDSAQAIKEWFATLP